MINITVFPVFAMLSAPLDSTMVDAVDELCSFAVAGSQFSPKFKRGHWDGQKHLFSKHTYKFPIGLLSKVTAYLQEQNLTYTITDLRKPLQHNGSLPHLVKPYDWQDTVINTCITAERGVIRVATGGGKSIIMTALIAHWNVSTLILVHKKDLLYQFKDHIIKNIGVTPGQIGDGVVDIQKFTVGMVQTISRTFNVATSPVKKIADDDSELEEDTTDLTLPNQIAIKACIQSVSCVIGDEIHALLSDGWYGLHPQFINARYKYGFSATPFKTNGSDLLLEAAFGTKIVDIRSSELIQMGYLSRPTFYFVKFRHAPVPKGLNYHNLYTQEITNNEERNYLITKLVTKFWHQNKKILVIIKHLAHGDILEKMLGEVLGAENVVFVQGKDDVDTRKKVITDLNTGKIRVVIASQIFTVGVDFPTLNVLCNAKAQKSDVDYIQTIGRALRKTGDKDTATIIDIYDHGCRYLTDHSYERMETAMEEPMFILNTIDSPKI